MPYRINGERPIVAEIAKYVDPVRSETFKPLGMTTHRQVNQQLRELKEQYPNTTFKADWRWA